MTTERIQIIVEERGAARVKRSFDDLGTGAQSNARRVDLLRNAIIGISAGAIITGLARLADQFTNLQNRLRTVTDSESQLRSVTRSLLDVSARTRSSFESTAEVFTRVSLATRQLGLTQQETLEFTESLNQAVILSGASSQEASAGLLQLSQGLASGTLRGDELRSVLEQLPTVADTIATSLGVTRGELRRLGEEGQISANDIIRAFREAAPELEENFGGTVVTLGQAFQRLRDQVLFLIGSFDSATGATGAVAQAILFVANNLENLITIVATLSAVIATRFIGAALTPLILSMRAAAVSAVFMASQVGTLSAASSLASVTVTGFAAAVRAAGASLLAFVGGPIGAALLAIGALFVAVNNLNAGFRNISNEFNTLQTVSGQTDDVIGRIDQTIQDYRSSVQDAADDTGELNRSIQELAGERRDEAIAQIEGQIRALEQQRDRVLAAIRDNTSGARGAAVDVAAFFTGSPSTGDFRGLESGVVASLDADLNRLAGTLDNLRGTVAEDFTTEAERIGESLSGGADAAQTASDALRDLQNELLVASQASEQSQREFAALIAAGLDPIADRGTEVAQQIVEIVNELARLEESADAAEELSRANQRVTDQITALQNEVRILSSEEGNQRDVLSTLISLGIDPTNEAYSEQVELITNLIEQKNALTEAEQRAAETARAEAAARERQADAIERASGLADATIADLDRQLQILSLERTEREALSQVLQVEQAIREQLIAGGADPNAVRITQAKREEIEARVRAIQAIEEETALLDELRGPQEDLIRRQELIEAKFNDKTLTAQEYNRALRDVTLSQAELRIELGNGSFADGFLLGLERMTGGVRSFAAEAGSIFSSFFSDLGTGFSNTIGDAVFDISELGESLKAVARDAISNLISSLVQLGLQFVANQILTQTIAAGATAASAGQAGALAAAWAPAAAAASLATGGANAVGAQVGIASTFALSRLLSSVPGFAEGTGFVTGFGTGTSDSIIARLSRGEGVVNAEANAANPGVVDRMNRGERVSGNVTQQFIFPNSDFNSFAKNRRQMAREGRAALGVT